MWSATTDAYTKGDFDWIKRTNYKLLIMMSIVFGLLIILVGLSPLVYHIWIGDRVQIPIVLSLLMALYSFIIMWSQSYSYMLNGMGKLRLQAINTIIVAVLFYPLVRCLGEHYFVPGILVGMCLVNISGAVLNTVQFNKIMRRTDTGIWSK
jgi:O-antigen/teichoic acid export membrane protein